MVVLLVIIIISIILFALHKLIMPFKQEVLDWDMSYVNDWKLNYGERVGINIVQHIASRMKRIVSCGGFVCCCFMS